jgi:hypothetical protein
VALSVFKGSFVANTSTGNQAVSGVGFQPTAILFWGNKLTAAGYGTGSSLFMGAATSTTERWAIAVIGDDAAADSNTARRNTASACILSLISGAAAVDSQADLVSFDSDGFTINWSDAPASAWLIHFYALGGSDITDAKAGRITGDPVAAGDEAITDPGFQPDFVLLATDSGTNVDTSLVHLIFSLGMASGATARGAMAIHERDNVATSNSGSYQVSDKCQVIMPAADSIGRTSDLTSFDATGFTINRNNGDAYSDFYLAIQGGQHKVGTETQKTSTGTKATTGVGFSPDGLFCFSTNLATSASINSTTAKVTIAAADGTNEGGSWNQHANGALTMDLDSRTYTDKAIGLSTQASTTDAEADVSSFDSDGFTLDWTTADGTAREFIYWAVAAEPVAVTTRLLASTGVGV